MDKKNKRSLLYNQDKINTETSGVSLLIPFKVKERIDSILKAQLINFNKITYEKAYYLAYIILKEQEQEELSLEDFFKPLAVNQYLKIGPPNGYFGEKFYKKAFLPLRSHLPSSSAAKSDTNSTKGSFDNSVFQSDGEYSKDQRVALLYRINPMLLDDEYTHVQLNNLIGDNELNQTYKVQLNHFYKTANSLSLDSEAITSNLDTEISPITIKRHDMPKESKKVRVYMAVRNMNEMYNYHETPLPNKQYKKYRLNNRIYSLKNEVSLNYIIKICENYNKNNQKNFAVIIDNNVIHLQEDEEFKEYKKDILTKDLDRKVKKIQNKYFTASISNSNGRLHSNFTNLNNIALKYSKINGCYLSAFDLKTSQPCILANLLLKKDGFIQALKMAKHPNLINHLDVFLAFDTEDYEMNFRDLLDTIIQDDIYSKLGETIQLNDEKSITSFHRNLAKLEVMRILFAKPNYNSQLLNIDNVFTGFNLLLKNLKNHFQDNFSDEKNHFNLFLQLVESYIFVEKIYYKCALSEIPSFTKHDSILFPRLPDTIDDKEMMCENAIAIEEIINSVFEEIHFEGCMKLTPHFYVNTDDPRFVGFEHSIEFPSMDTIYGKFN